MKKDKRDIRTHQLCYKVSDNEYDIILENDKYLEQIGIKRSELIRALVKIKPSSAVLRDLGLLNPLRGF